MTPIGLLIALDSVNISAENAMADSNGAARSNGTSNAAWCGNDRAGKQAVEC
jgi:hypothetical protein